MTGTTWVAALALCAFATLPLAARTDDAKRLAGTLRFDKTAAGGPKVDIEFDAALVKALSAP